MTLLTSLLSLCVMVSHAYIPPSEFLIRQMVKKRDGYRSVYFKSTLIELQENQPTGLKFSIVTVLDYKAGRITALAKDSLDKPLFYAERNVRQSGVLADDILFTQAPEVLLANLRNLGLKIEPTPTPTPTPAPITSWTSPLPSADPRSVRPWTPEEPQFIARFQNRISWVIGQKSGGIQFWLEKDAFLPMRFLLPNSGGIVELRFNEMRSVKEFLLPSQIDLLWKDKALLREEIGEVSVNDLNPLLMPAGTPTNTPLEAASGLSDPSKELLKQFFLYLR